MKKLLLLSVVATSLSFYNCGKKKPMPQKTEIKVQKQKVVIGIDGKDKTDLQDNFGTIIKKNRMQEFGKHLKEEDKNSYENAADIFEIEKEKSAKIKKVKDELIATLKKHGYQASDLKNKFEVDKNGEHSSSTIENKVVYVDFLHYDSKKEKETIITLKVITTSEGKLEFTSEKKQK